MVQNALNGWDLHSLDFVFTGNFGSLVCPSACHLREDLLPVTAGQDKPLKYTTIFSSPNVTITTKSDLADALECDEGPARRKPQTVRPGMGVFRLSAKSGDPVPLPR